MIDRRKISLPRRGFGRAAPRVCVEILCETGISMMRALSCQARIALLVSGVVAEFGRGCPSASRAYGPSAGARGGRRSGLRGQTRRPLGSCRRRAVRQGFAQSGEETLDRGLVEANSLEAKA